MRVRWLSRWWLRVDEGMITFLILEIIVLLFCRYAIISCHEHPLPSQYILRISANMSHLNLLRLAQPSIVLPYFVLHILQAIVHVPELLRLRFVRLVLRHPLVERLVLLVVFLEALRLLQHLRRGLFRFLW